MADFVRDLGLLELMALRCRTFSPIDIYYFVHPTNLSTGTMEFQMISHLKTMFKPNTTG